MLPRLWITTPTHRLNWECGAQSAISPKMLLSPASTKNETPAASGEVEASGEADAKGEGEADREGAGDGLGSGETKAGKEDAHSGQDTMINM